MPMVTAPAESHDLLAKGRSAALILSARPRTAYAARMATTTESVTSVGSYVPASADPGSMLPSRNPQ
ncbi:MAG: hypothetical protein DME00_07155 [Candidatus Rokuibacteriota bacterium]|nr:MAG: hypothetical protein DME00_07155 [Candidatus Rokubacteria bacterium]